MILSNIAFIQCKLLYTEQFESKINPIINGTDTINDDSFRLHFVLWKAETAFSALLEIQ